MRGSSGCKLGRASVCVISAEAQNRDGGHRSSAKAGRLSAGNCESSGSQAGSCAKTQAGKGRRMQIPDLVLHGSSVFLHIV